MKKIFFYCIVLFSFQVSFAQNVKIEEVKKQCTGLATDKRVNLSVSSFNVATMNNPGQFGDELAQMLTNALQGVSCFNVRLSIKDMKAITDEQQFQGAGNTDVTTNNLTGKIQSAQVIVMGKVTEYSSGEKKTTVLGISAAGGNKAHVGFIISLINATTGMLIDSKSINVDGKTGGFSGGKLFGVELGGTKSNKSLQDACEKGITEAVEFIASRKNDMPLPVPNNSIAAKKYSASNCTVLSSAYIPKIMVILPEYHLTRRVPDPAGETEINRMFIEAGFNVVDPAMYAAIEQTAQFSDAAKDPMKAISLGKKFGADIVIYGEAFSQLAGTLGSNQISGVQNGNQVSCRARVEVKAVRTDNATMIAANGKEAGAVDNAEAIASKSALRNAAFQLSNYLLEQFCSRPLSFSKPAGGGGGAASTAAAGKSITEITVSNADYPKLKSLSDGLAAKGTVVEKTLKEGKGYIKFEHTGSSDSIADFIESKLGTKFSVKNSESGSLSVEAK